MIAQNHVLRKYIFTETSPRCFPAEVMETRKRLVQKAKLIALLHDLGHGPFGHALDNYIAFANAGRSSPAPDKYFTSIYIKTYLSETLKAFDFDPDNIISILEPSERYRLTGTDLLIGELIDSPIDVDRLDYLVRDAHMTGLTMGL